MGSEQGNNNEATKLAEISTLSRPATLWSLVEKDPPLLRCPNTASLTRSSDVADPSITGSSPTVANEKIKQYALVGYCNGSIQYLIQGELMQGCLKSSLTWTQLKFWNTRGLALKIWCQMGFCKHDKSCDSLQVRRASRIRRKNEQSP